MVKNNLFLRISTQWIKFWGYMPTCRLWRALVFLGPYSPALLVHSIIARYKINTSGFSLLLPHLHAAWSAMQLYNSSCFMTVSAFCFYGIYLKKYLSHFAFVWIAIDNIKIIFGSDPSNIKFTRIRIRCKIIV